LFESPKTDNSKSQQELHPIKGKDGAKIRISKEGLTILKLIIAHHHCTSSRLGEVLDPVNTTTVSFMLYRETMFREDTPLGIWEVENYGPQRPTHKVRNTKSCWNKTTPKY
jgi:hypothetical protein